MTLSAGSFDCAPPVTAPAMRFFPVFVLAGWLLSTGLSAQETSSATITLSNGDSARIKVGAEHAEPGETRYPRRSYIGDTGSVVEFSLLAPPEGGGESRRGPPPSLADLIGNSSRQAALDASAKPGDWVTPPAAKR